MPSILPAYPPTVKERLLKQLRRCRDAHEQGLGPDPRPPRPAAPRRPPPLAARREEPQTGSDPPPARRPAPARGGHLRGRGGHLQARPGKGLQPRAPRKEVEGGHPE